MSKTKQENITDQFSFLQSKYGIHENEIKKIDEFEIPDFTSAQNLFQEQQENSSIYFGVDSLDQLFTMAEYGTSGIRSGESYEFFGAAGTGKTQLLHWLTIMVQLPLYYGGLNKKAIYIDTEGTFSPARIKQMARYLMKVKKWKRDLNSVLSNISIAKVRSTKQLLQTTKRLDQQANNYGIIIIDSLTARFRTEYTGRGQLPQRQQKIAELLHVLDKLRSEHNIAIVVSNQVKVNIKKNTVESIGGSVLSHWANTRCYLRKSKGEKRIIRIVDSPVLPENEAVFEITVHGIEGKV